MWRPQEESHSQVPACLVLRRCSSALDLKCTKQDVATSALAGAPERAPSLWYFAPQFLGPIHWQLLLIKSPKHIAEVLNAERERTLRERETKQIYLDGQRKEGPEKGGQQPWEQPGLGVGWCYASTPRQTEESGCQETSSVCVEWRSSHLAALEGPPPGKICIEYENY